MRFLLGLLLGIALGVAVGLVLAPQPGSETRKALRRFFEIDAEHVAVAALYALAEGGELDRAVVTKAAGELGVNADAPAPWTV